MNQAMTGREQCMYYLDRIAAHCGTGDLRAYLHELESDQLLLRRLEASVASEPAFTTKHFASVLDLRLVRIAAYALTRARKPKVFVETGVLHGLTSAFVLRALAENGTGRLVSIDLPSRVETGPSNQDGCFGVLPPGREPGWAIPREDRERWELRVGASVDQLPEVVSAYPVVDIFMHDSEHTVETMTAEFRLAWPSLPRGGILFADNVDMNEAFTAFSREVQREPLLFPAPDSRPTEVMRCGLLVK